MSDQKLSGNKHCENYFVPPDSLYPLFKKHCPHCDKVFESIFDLSHHMKTHATEHSSSREFCDQIFSTPAALNSVTDSETPVNNAEATAGSDCPQLFLQVSENKVKK